ncbi:MAG: hypothetical protein L0206_07760 [Actinobacteria bacterium]|nr:hypothetical protein [Actinomycetota bacterium]
MRHRAIALGLALTALLAASPADAHDLAPLLERHGDLPHVRRLKLLHARLDRMLVRYERLERDAGRGWLAFVEAQRAVDEAVRGAGAASNELETRVRCA